MIENASIVDFIWDSTKEAFETMIPLPVERKNEQHNSTQISSSLICTITFTGQIQGTFSVLCSAEGVEKMARAMLMMEPEDLLDDDEICDAYGEVANILVGGLKSRIIESTPDMKISIPSVVRGQQIRATAGTGISKVELDVDLDGCPMRLGMAYRTWAL